MAEFSFPFDTQGGLAQETTEATGARLWRMLARSQGTADGVDDLGWYGTLPGRAGSEPGALEVTRTGGGLLSVAAGDALVAGFAYQNTTAKTLTPSSNPGGSAGDRIDSVILQLNRSGSATAQGTPDSEIRAVIKEGVPAANPAPPAPTTDADNVYEILLRSATMRRGQSTYASTDLDLDGRTFLRYRSAGEVSLSTTTTTSRDFVERAGVAPRVYVPPSGRVRVTVSAEMDNTASGGFADLSFRVRRGGTVTGTAVVEPARNLSARKEGPNAVTASRTVTVSGLDPGLCTLVSCVRAAGSGTASITDWRVVVEPEL